MLTFITGGARSGKSRFAQSLSPPGARTGFLATARILDSEMGARVQRHRKERPPEWTTVEEPVCLSTAAKRLAGDCDVVLVDCLTLWTTNLLMDMPDRGIESIRERAFRELDALAQDAARVSLVVVSNEVGSGVVPAPALCRRFTDLHGWINQRVAARADRVVLMVSGIPVEIKTLRRDNE